MKNLIVCILFVILCFICCSEKETTAPEVPLTASVNVLAWDHPEWPKPHQWEPQSVYDDKLTIYYAIRNVSASISRWSVTFKVDWTNNHSSFPTLSGEANITSGGSYSTSGEKDISYTIPVPYTVSSIEVDDYTLYK